MLLSDYQGVDKTTLRKRCAVHLLPIWAKWWKWVVDPAEWVGFRPPTLYVWTCSDSGRFRAETL